MNITEFNQLNHQKAKTLLLNCVKLTRWVDKVNEQRPYQNLAKLQEAASQYFDLITFDEIRLSLDNHPKIGEKKAKAELSEKEAEFSNQEQPTFQQEDIKTKIALGNQLYENKFGFIFLVRAKHRTAEEIYQELTRRLNNNLSAEMLEIKRELKDITLLRLNDLIDSD